MWKREASVEDQCERSGPTLPPENRPDSISEFGNRMWKFAPLLLLEFVNSSADSVMSLLEEDLRNAVDVASAPWRGALSLPPVDPASVVLMGE